MALLQRNEISNLAPLPSTSPLLSLRLPLEREGGERAGCLLVPYSVHTLVQYPNQTPHAHH
jgi:hypothetical protein